MSGVEVARAVREMNCPIYIVGCTGNALREDQVGRRCSTVSSAHVDRLDRTSIWLRGRILSLPNLFTKNISSKWFVMPVAELRGKHNQDIWTTPTNPPWALCIWGILSRGCLRSPNDQEEIEREKEKIQNTRHPSVAVSLFIHCLLLPSVQLVTAMPVQLFH